ncbi:MAG: PhzF family phenazine biosynthesis protein [Rhizobiaceae bacterium]|nr:PhzF family phenazine biosynthesis protein [Rhizobiaceae bacterium]
MDIERLAAFTQGEDGGNPAGVVICDTLPDEAVMQQIARDVGYSETVFASRQGSHWRTRYFAPAKEIPFCGHATIALGAALADKYGDNSYLLRLNDGEVSVYGKGQPTLSASLEAPISSNRSPEGQYLEQCLALFSYSEADLDTRITPAIINAGANHLLIALNSRERLREMAYDLEVGRALMAKENLATISLVFAETNALFHARNPFAAGGVYEDPATGAAAAALGGYLRAIGWPHSGSVKILQGEDMGVPTNIFVELPEEHDARIKVFGTVRRIL